MAAKRLHDGSENEEDRRDEKRMHRLPSFSTVIKEAVMMKQVHNVFMLLEPLLRRVVQEELQAGLVRSPRYIERSSPETSPPPPSSPRATWRLAFLNPPQLPIFTGSKIEDANGNPLQVILVDADTGSPCQNVPQFLRVEVVPIFGDFPHDGREECGSAAEFARGVVKERAGKRPLLTGEVALTMRDGRATVGELQFTDNSSWLRCRKFRIGARVVPGSGYDGPRVAEAMTEAFNVRDHRGELYRKHYPPALGDDVWRLEKIGKEGAFHKKLTQSGVRTVQEFLQMLVVKPDVLRMIMGDGMTDRMWEATTKHARQCEAGDRVYAYTAGQTGGVGGATVYVNSICQLVKIELAGVECVPQHLNRAQKAYVHQLLLEAFEQRASLQEADILLHASHSSNDLPLLQNAAPAVPPPLPATPLWFQGTPDIDFQIIDDLANQGNFTFKMFDE
ncbi:protein SAR DEFICIENT 1-like [Lolium rigidum]|uniref:protein SAR DEFICIENT 1-like n=1 Tax=Lolium rigidum TaxID=89674 RepID=UPI001F5C96E1|nr:protein SAR DEFICIENT 1-like [Lolium rigidum]